MQKKNKKTVILTDLLELVIIDLRKVKKEYLEKPEEIINQWMMMIKDPNAEEVKRIMERNEEIGKTIKRAKELSDNKDVRRLAELREKKRMDEEDIREALMEKGLKERNRATE